MSVEVQRNVDDPSAVNEAVRRRVRPPAGKVDAHRAPPPDDLVPDERQPRRGTVLEARGDDRLLQQRKRLLFVRLAVLLPQVRHTRLEHVIVYTLHQRSVAAEVRRQRDIERMIVVGEFLEIQLIEDRVFVVLRDQRDRDAAILRALLVESHEIGGIADLRGRQFHGGQILPLALFIVAAAPTDHPLDERFGQCVPADDGEDLCELDVGAVRCERRTREPPRGEPFAARPAHPRGVRPPDIALERVGVAEGPDAVRVPADRDDVQTDRVRHLERPLVPGHARDHLVLPELPVLADVRILDPQVLVVRRERHFRYRIQDEDRRVRFDLAVPDRALVEHAILQGHARFDELVRRAEVIELTLVQRDHRRGQRVELLVLRYGDRSQSQPEVAVEIVVSGNVLRIRIVRIPPAAFLHQHLHGPVAQEPHTDVDQLVVPVGEFDDLFRRGLLQHERQIARLVAFEEEHAVMRRLRRLRPDAEAHDVGRRYVGNGPLVPDQHVAACDQRVGMVGGGPHDLLEERQLQVQQFLLYVLPAAPSEHGQRGEDLSGRGIRGKPAAQPACMDDDPLFLRQPVRNAVGSADVRRLIRPPVGNVALPAFAQRVRRAAARTDTRPVRVRRDEPLLRVLAFEFDETCPPDSAAG